MPSSAADLQHPALVRFFRSPKGSLFIILSLLALLATPVEGSRAVVGTALAVLAAVGTETLLWWGRPRAASPSGAVLTGFIVGLVLSPAEPLYVPMLAAVLGIVSKRFVRVSGAHLFNPAAAGLLASAVLFGSQQSWWGGLSDLPAAALLLLVLMGALLLPQVNKFPSVLAFLGVYFSLFSAAAAGGNPIAVAEIFRQPFLGTVLFFALFMLTDPPTTPARGRQQAWFGAAVAVASFACYMLTSGAIYYLLAALLAGNLWEGMRRWSGIRSARKRQGSAVGRAPSSGREDFGYLGVASG